MQQGSDKNTTIVGIIAIAIIAAAVVGTIALKPKSSTTDTGTSTPSSSTQSDTTGSPKTTGPYKDGTYSATGRYSSPGGNEEIAITITIQNGVATETSASAIAADRESREYQNDFVASYKTQVVGKAIDEILLSKVAGSSLTSTGFNRALETIKTQAKV